MRVGKHLVMAVMLLTLIGGVACKKKKPNLPPQTQPPTITQPEPENPPAQVQPDQIPPETTPPATETAPQPVPPAPKPKPHRRKKPAPTTSSTPETTAKPSAAKPANSGKTVIDSTKPPETNVQISAEVPQNVANQRKQQTEDLLNVAEANLKKVNRTLTDGEQSMQHQVRNFITQSRLAIQDGDFERAYNLATKAQQLSQELVK